MTQILKIGTLNINGIKADMKLEMLETFLWCKDIDILLLQEVMTHKLRAFSNYTTHLNMGPEGRGTAILLKNDLESRNLRRLPSGRGMSIHVQELCLITVYAPSGAEKQREREDFFMLEVPNLIPTTPTEMILAGDLNCTLARADSTGPPNYSRALDIMIKTLDLHDVWTPTSRTPGYTYYGPRTASRIDRIYVTEQIQMRKPTVDLVATAFSDHHAVTLNVPLSRSIPRRRRGYWKMNICHIQDKSWLTDFSRQWTTWQTHKKYYSNEVGWWCRYIKPMLRNHFLQIDTAIRRDRQHIENFYYAAVYDLQDEIRDNTYDKLRHLKAKITRLYATPQRRLYVDIDELDKLEGEEASLYQLIRQRTRQKARLIEHIQDDFGTCLTDPGEVMRFFTAHMDAKYARKQTDTEAMQAILRMIHTVMPTEAVPT
jgi:exonuclease III